MSDVDLPALYAYDPDDWEDKVNDALFRGRVSREAKRILKEEENPPQALPEGMLLSERRKREREKTVFRIREWQPANGRVVLAAQYKAGKTSTVGNLVRSLADGDKWLGRWGVKAVEGAITILDFEMSENTAEDWLMAQGIVNEDKVNLVSLRGRGATFNILDVGLRKEWASRLAECATDYLILDCLRPALDALNLDEHKDAGRFLGPFDALLNDAGISEALVVHHMGHGGERGRGDSRLRDWPDVEWRLVRENEHPESTRFITAFGRDVAIAEHRLEFDKRTRHIRALPGTRLDADADAALVAVMHVVSNEDEAITGNRIELALKDTDYSRKAIRAALRLAVRRGLLDMRAGANGTPLFDQPRSWVRARFGGGEGEEDI